jgi:hypothetical protein
MTTTYKLLPDEQRSTRDCIDPWFFAFLTARRGLKPCCWHPPIGTLAVGQPLEELLEGPAMRELRRQLLTGELNEYCVRCPTYALTDPASLQERVRAEIAGELASKR